MQVFGALRLALYIVSFLSTPSTSYLVNVTVDDQYGDPVSGNAIVYSPNTSWTQGNTCVGCFAKLNPDKTWDATWHDVTFEPSTPDRSEVQTAAFHFVGSAIYVFGILSRSLGSGATSTSNLTFFIDGQQTGDFIYSPPSLQNEYVYNVMLWSNDTMSLGPHTVVIQNGHSGGRTSLILLDYMIYTRDIQTDGTSIAFSDTVAATSVLSPENLSLLATLSPSGFATDSPTPEITSAPNLTPVSTADPSNVPATTYDQPAPTNHIISGATLSHYKRMVVVAAVIPSTVVMLLLASACFVLHRRRATRNRTNQLRGDWIQRHGVGNMSYEMSPVGLNVTDKNG